MLTKIAQISQEYREHFPLLEDSPRSSDRSKTGLILDEMAPSIGLFEEESSHSMGVRCSHYSLSHGVDVHPSVWTVVVGCH
jgi:hypothetical protein